MVKTIKEFKKIKKKLPGMRQQRLVRPPENENPSPRYQSWQTSCHNPSCYHHLHRNCKLQDLFYQSLEQNWVPKIVSIYIMLTIKILPKLKVVWSEPVQHVLYSVQHVLYSHSVVLSSLAFKRRVYPVRLMQQD